MPHISRAEYASTCPSVSGFVKVSLQQNVGFEPTVHVGNVFWVDSVVVPKDWESNRTVG